jgi:hypothetical protein
MDYGILLYQSLSNLIKISEFLQLKSRQFNSLPNLGIKSYLKEISTIKLCCSRHSGHTSAIVKMVKNNPNTIVLYPNKISCNIFNSLCEKENIKDVKCKNISKDNLLKFRGLRTNCVIIDNSFFLGKKEIDMVYDFCKPFALHEIGQGNNFFIIFME